MIKVYQTISFIIIIYDTVSNITLSITLFYIIAIYDFNFLVLKLRFLPAFIQKFELN
jgi:hypothetical protein